jgi:hypothetical protein
MRANRTHRDSRVCRRRRATRGCTGSCPTSGTDANLSCSSGAGTSALARHCRLLYSNIQKHIIFSETQSGKSSQNSKHKCEKFAKPFPHTWEKLAKFRTKVLLLATVCIFLQKILAKIRENWHIFACKLLCLREFALICVQIVC